MAGSVSGSSRCPTIRERQDIRSFGPTRSSWWTVPYWAATCLAYGNSENSGGPSNPTEKVLNGSAPVRLISATTDAESSPPLRKAPTGTSLARWLFTASCNRPATAVRISASARLPSFQHVVGSCQYRRGSRPRSFTSSTVPGMSFRMPTKAVSGAGTYCRSSSRSSAGRLTSGTSSKAGSSPRTSDAKAARWWS